jgi:hypothetical protein
MLALKDVWTLFAFIKRVTPFSPSLLSNARHLYPKLEPTCSFLGIIFTLKLLLLLLLGRILSFFTMAKRFVMREAFRIFLLIKVCFKRILKKTLFQKVCFGVFAVVRDKE